MMLVETAVGLFVQAVVVTAVCYVLLAGLVRVASLIQRYWDAERD
jgi:hypothetical protein